MDFEFIFESSVGIGIIAGVLKTLRGLKKRGGHAPLISKGWLPVIGWLIGALYGYISTLDSFVSPEVGILYGIAIATAANSGYDSIKGFKGKKAA